MKKSEQISDTICLHKDTELANCSFAKTVMMLVIVFYHCILDVNSYFVEALEIHPVINILKDWLASFHNYCFVLISGYIFYHIKYEKNRYKQFWPFVKKKLNRLIVPFIFISLIWAIPLNCYIFKVGILSENTLKNFILGIAPSQLWFLLMLFWVFVLFYIISDFVKKNTLIGVLLVLFLHCVGVLATHYIPNIYRIFDGLGFMVFIYIGFVIRQYNLIDKIQKYGMIWLILAEIILFVVYEFIKDNENIIIKIINTLGVQLTLNIIGCILAFVVLQGIADKLNYSNSKVYKYCEKRSMGVYLFHQQLVHLCFLFLVNVCNVYLVVPISFVISFFVSAVIHDIICRFRTGRILLGEND